MNAVTPPVVDRSSDVKTGTASFNNPRSRRRRPGPAISNPVPHL